MAFRDNSGEKNEKEIGAVTFFSNEPARYLLLICVITFVHVCVFARVCTKTNAYREKLRPTLCSARSELCMGGVWNSILSLKDFPPFLNLLKLFEIEWKMGGNHYDIIVYMMLLAFGWFYFLDLVRALANADWGTYTQRRIASTPPGVSK